RARDKAEKIIVFLCDSGSKYVSKIFNDDWMRENGFLAEQPGLGTVKDVISKLKTLGISQLPVIGDDGKLRGIVGEVDLLRHLVTGGKTLDSTVGELVEGDYATVTPQTKIEL